MLNLKHGDCIGLISPSTPISNRAPKRYARSVEFLQSKGFKLKPGNLTGRKPYQILEEVLGNYTFPFLAEVDCCHTHPMFTIPLGAELYLDSGKKIIELRSWRHQSSIN